MKKTTLKKLTLNRETVRGLDSSNLGEVAGGATTACVSKSPTYCVSCKTECTANCA